jgi:hypothetical protein
MFSRFLDHLADQVILQGALRAFARCCNHDGLGPQVAQIQIRSRDGRLGIRAKASAGQRCGCEFTFREPPLYELHGYGFSFDAARDAP